MNAMKYSKLAERLDSALRNCVKAELIAALYELTRVVLEQGGYPPEVFAGLSHTIRLAEFVRCPQAWLLLKHYEENWEFITQDQAADLLQVLPGIFSKGADPKLDFMVATLLSDCYTDDESGRVLESLKARAVGESKDLLSDAIKRRSLRNTR